MTLLRSPIHSPIRSPIYNPLSGKWGAGYSDEAQALFARFTTPPTDARKVLINNLIVSLKASGIWTKLDAFYMMAAETAQAARQNWVADRYNLSAINSPTFTADQGYAGDGASSYLNTNFNPATAITPNFVQDSAHGSFSDRTTRGALGTLQMGASTPSSFSLSMTSRFTGDVSVNRANSPSAGSVQYANSLNPGRYLVSRTGPAAQAAYKNGASAATSTATSSAVPSNNIYIGCANINGSPILYSTDQFSQASMGGGLSDAQVASFDIAISTYLTAVGA